ncbi:hypothetical protein [Candidatus Mycoplasma haematominutum]|uniref:Uncharacterized protein n=1 Tax=Candidatus Mycoplasma haematominutum 'Birmingham 1' TaxID=1116213 RepID=G8C2S2_9MOLU|nr:hypothetical protein [Candidatus Mycoplasma haematominutum]CCE66620.1 hypothetical protein MHM_01020 [Candidatus Mycoplasma haematominutum 'Birmingham 1']
MAFLWSFFKVVLLGGGISSIVLPSLVATGFKDYDGYGKSNNPGSSTGWTAGSRPTEWKKYDDQAKQVGASAGIHVGRIPWKTKIGGKLKTKCSNSYSNISLGSQSWTVGRKNWYKNKKLFGEIEVKCQGKTHTLYLKWEDENTSKRGWYGRIK